MALSAFRRRSTYGDKFSPPQCTTCEIQLDSGSNFYTSPYLFNVGVHLCSKPSKLIFSRLSWDFESIFYIRRWCLAHTNMVLYWWWTRFPIRPLTTLWRKHGATKLLVLFDKHTYNEIWKHYSSYIIYHYSLYIKRWTRFPSRPLTTLWSKHGATKSKHSTTTPQFDTTLTNRKQSTW